jgi:hypothetical protein
MPVKPDSLQIFCTAEKEAFQTLYKIEYLRMQAYYILHWLKGSRDDSFWKLLTLENRILLINIH